MNQKPEDDWDRVSLDGYFGKMKSKFDEHKTKGFTVYVIELNPEVWEGSIRRNTEKKSRRWIPSFPMCLPDPKIEKSDDWKELDVNEIKGFLYVGQSWQPGIRYAEHCEGGRKSSPVVYKHGCNQSQIWPNEKCLSGLYNTENSLMLESWYGWALGRCGYVVYGPHYHRTHKRFGELHEEEIGFLGKDPFW